MQKQQNNNGQNYYSQPFGSPKTSKNNNHSQYTQYTQYSQYSQYASHNGHTRANSSQRYLRPSDQFPATSDYESDAYYIDSRPPPPSNALMNRTNPQINLSVLKRYVPSISEVLEVEPKVILYELPLGEDEWLPYKIDKADDKTDDKSKKSKVETSHEASDTEGPHGKPAAKTKLKSDIEGPMFVCTQGEMIANERKKGRDGACIFLLNEKGPVSFMIDLATVIHFEAHAFPATPPEDGNKNDIEYVVFGTMFIFRAGENEMKTYGAVMRETEEDRKERDANGTKKELIMSSRAKRIKARIETLWENARDFQMKRETFGLHDVLQGGGGANVNPAAQVTGQEININSLFGFQNER